MFFNKKKNLILIYTMGKVASVSIEKTLENYIDQKKIALYRVHQLTQDDFDYHKKYILKSGITESEKQFSLNFINEYKAIDEIINSKNINLKIISGFRDPVEISIAGLFQNISVIFPSYSLLSAENACHTMIKIFNSMLTTYQSNISGNRLISRYGGIFDIGALFFDQQIKKKFNMDVYRSDIDSSQDYHIFESNNISLFVYKFESLKKISNPLYVFLDPLIKSKFTIGNENVGSSKDYSKIYDLFKKKLKLNNQNLDYFYDNKHVKKFYTNKEIKSFYAKWSN